MMSSQKLHKNVQEAICQFWAVREKQGNSQGKESDKDRGARASVTGGKQLDGFIKLFTQLCTDAGVTQDAIKIAQKKSSCPAISDPQSDGI